MRKMRKAYILRIARTKGRGHLGDVGVGVRIILRLILEKEGGNNELD
jgi:hypothetical protein